MNLTMLHGTKEMRMFELKEGQVYWNQFGTKIYIEKVVGNYVYITESTVKYGKEDFESQVSIDRLIRHMTEWKFTLFREA